MTPDRPPVSIVITTRNRPVELQRAVRSCLAQDYRPLELIVYDDASEMDMAKVLGAEYPEVRVVRLDQPAGYIVLRNRGFREAAGKYVFSLDDDAYYTDAATVRAVVNLLESDAHIAGAAIPYLESADRIALSSLRAPRTAAPGDKVRSFIGCAHALRRQAVLEAGGYREFFIHQGEERDLSIRLYAAGYHIVMAGSAPIVHDVSAVRDHRLRRFGVRNTMLFDFLNLPLRYGVPLMIYHGMKMTVYRARLRDLPGRVLVAVKAFCETLTFWRQRSPVPADLVRPYFRMPTHGPRLPADGILPPPCGSVH